LPQAEGQRGLLDILREPISGKQADQGEVNAAVGRSTRYLLPVMIFLFTVNIASALSLYWLVGGVVAYIQQAFVLREDEEEMEEIADKPSKDVTAIPEAEIIARPSAKKSSKKVPKSKRRKRR